MIEESLAEKTPSSLYRKHPRNHPKHINPPKQIPNIPRIPPTYNPNLFNLTPTNLTKQFTTTINNNNIHTLNHNHHPHNHLNHNHIRQT